MGFINRTGAEIGCLIDKKNSKKSFFIIEKIQNIESAQLCRGCKNKNPPI